MTDDRRLTLREGRRKAGRTLAKVTFGKALEGLRMTRELKQSDVARATGLTRAMVSAFETGKVYPSLESLFAYLGGVGCDLGNLQQELDKAAGRREGTPDPLPPSAEEVYRRIGKAVIRTIDEVCRELGPECSSERPPSAGTSGEGGNRKEE
jgi:transcriptional regulator with XRE-family HTH domain